MIQIQSLDHVFKIGKKGRENEIPVLKDIDLSIKRGEIACIVGRSGSGKSTLLNLISGYITPTSGQIMVDGTNVTGFNEKEWADFRLDHFGFIFQSFQLIGSLTTYENVELPLTLKGVKPSERKVKVKEMLKRVGLEHHAGHYPNELSGGQQQRVSIARALILNPSIILADEPTASLDTENAMAVMRILKEQSKQRHKTCIIVTHDERLTKFCDKTYHMEDGYLKEK